MKVLFVDTTTSDLVVAVIEEKNVTAVINKDTQRWHSQLLCEKVNEALTKANTDFGRFCMRNRSGQFYGNTDRRSHRKRVCNGGSSPIYCAEFFGSYCMFPDLRTKGQRSYRCRQRLLFCRLRQRNCSCFDKIR